MAFEEYAAGFFDGEGCVTASQTDRGYARLQLSVVQHIKKPLLALRKNYGGKIYERTSSGARFAWRLHSISDMSTFLHHIRPHLLVKAAVVDLALELLSGMQTGKGWPRVSDEERRRRNRLGQRMRKLNQAT